MPQPDELRLDLIPTGRLRLDGGAMFGVVPRVLWEKVAKPDELNRIEMALNCLLIRTGGRTILVETGMGDKWSVKERSIYGLRSEAGLRGGLADLGVLPREVDTVILTHLHFDHAGGATVGGSPGGPIPLFPNAMHWVQRREWETASQLNERTRASYREENFAPLEHAGLIRRVEGETEVVPGVSVVPLPGHTLGLQGVKIEAGGETILYPSDLIPTAAHLPYPYIMGYDLFPLTTLETKKRILPRALAEGWRLVLVHEPEHPVGRLVEEKGRIRLVPADLP